MSRWSNQRHAQNRFLQFLLDSNKDQCCCAQPDSNPLSPAEAAIIYLHKFTKLPPANHHNKVVKNNSKLSLTLACGITVTSQRQSGEQHGVLHDIGGLKKGALL
jgi:hypothetical protein